MSSVNKRMRLGGLRGKEVASEMDQSNGRSPGIGGTCAIVLRSSRSIYRPRCMFAFTDREQSCKNLLQPYVFAYIVGCVPWYRVNGIPMELAWLGMVSMAFQE